MAAPAPAPAPAPVPAPAPAPEAAQAPQEPPTAIPDDAWAREREWEQLLEGHDPALLKHLAHIRILASYRSLMATRQVKAFWRLVHALQGRRLTAEEKKSFYVLNPDPIVAAASPIHWAAGAADKGFRCPSCNSTNTAAAGRLKSKRLTDKGVLLPKWKCCMIAVDAAKEQGLNPCVHCFACQGTAEMKTQAGQHLWGFGTCFAIVPMGKDCEMCRHPHATRCICAFCNQDATGCTAPAGGCQCDPLSITTFKNRQRNRRQKKQQKVLTTKMAQAVLKPDASSVGQPSKMVQAQLLAMMASKKMSNVNALGVLLDMPGVDGALGATGFNPVAVRAGGGTGVDADSAIAKAADRFTDTSKAAAAGLLMKSTTAQRTRTTQHTIDLTTTAELNVRRQQLARQISAFNNLSANHSAHGRRVGVLTTTGSGTSSQQQLIPNTSPVPPQLGRTPPPKGWLCRRANCSTVNAQSAPRCTACQQPRSALTSAEGGGGGGGGGKGHNENAGEGQAAAGDKRKRKLHGVLKQLKQYAKTQGNCTPSHLARVKKARNSNAHLGVDADPAKTALARKCLDNTEFREVMQDMSDPKAQLSDEVKKDLLDELEDLVDFD